jgi:hypothetical protein
MVVQAVVVIKIAVADKQDALREIRRGHRLGTKNPNQQRKTLGEIHGEPRSRLRRHKKTHHVATVGF